MEKKCQTKCFSPLKIRQKCHSQMHLTFSIEFLKFKILEICVAIRSGFRYVSNVIMSYYRDYKFGKF